MKENLIHLQKQMLAFAFRLTFNREKAEDLRQETSLKVLVNLDKYYTNINFKNWVYAIMRNIFMNECRRSKLRRMINTDELIQNLPPKLRSPSPEEEYGYREMMKIVNGVGEEFREPLLMYLSGYKYKEIAGIMKTPLGTVKSRIFAARKRVQKQLVEFR